MSHNSTPSPSHPTSPNSKIANKLHQSTHRSSLTFDPASYVPENAPLLIALRILPLDNKLHILSFLHRTQLRRILRRSPSLKPIFRSHSELKTVLFSLDDIPGDVISKNIAGFLADGNEASIHALSCCVSPKVREELLDNDELWASLSRRKRNALNRDHRLMHSMFTLYPRIITRPRNLKDIHFARQSTPQFTTKAVYNPREAVDIQWERRLITHSFYQRLAGDSCKLLLFVCSYLVFFALTYIFVLWLSLAFILVPLVNAWWPAYIAYGFSVLAALSFIPFVLLYIFTLDYEHPIFTFVRNSAWVDRIFFRSLGLMGDFRRHKWNIMQTEMLTHLLWIPLMLLLYTVKWAVQFHAPTWTYWTLPIYCVWALYLASTLFHSCLCLAYWIRSQKRERSPFTIIGRLYVCFSFYTQFFTFLIFYVLMFGGLLMLFGKIDGWAPGIPYSCAFIPLELAFLYFLFIADCFPFAYGLACCVDTVKRGKTQLSALNDLVVVTGASIYQAANFVNISLLLDRVWPFFVTMILMGLQLDGVLKVHWAWIMCPMIMWAGVECAVINLVLYLGCGLLMMMCSLCYFPLQFARALYDL